MRRIVAIMLLSGLAGCSAPACNGPPSLCAVPASYYSVRAGGQGAVTRSKPAQQSADQPPRAPAPPLIPNQTIQNVDETRALIERMDRRVKEIREGL
jgi:hypothetical protein